MSVTVDQSTSIIEINQEDQTSIQGVATYLGTADEVPLLLSSPPINSAVVVEYIAVVKQASDIAVQSAIYSFEVDGAGVITEVDSDVTDVPALEDATFAFDVADGITLVFTNDTGEQARVTVNYKVVTVPFDLPTVSPTPTATSTRTPTPTVTRTPTITVSPTPPVTRSATPTATSTSTVTPTATVTPSTTVTPTNTVTPTVTATPTPTVTPSV